MLQSKNGGHCKHVLEVRHRHTAHRFIKTQNSQIQILGPKENSRNQGLSKSQREMILLRVQCQDAVRDREALGGNGADGENRVAQTWKVQGFLFNSSSKKQSLKTKGGVLERDTTELSAQLLGCLKDKGALPGALLWRTKVNHSSGLRLL